MSKLLDLLPYRLLSPPVIDFETAMETAVQAMENAYWEMTGEIYGGTAEKWMVLWEKAYGIPTDIRKSIGDRRAQLVSKMRGTGTATKEMVRKVAASFSPDPADCTVIEHPEMYQLQINFVDLPNMRDVRRAVEEIKPAHLELLLGYLPRPIELINLQKFALERLQLHLRCFNGERQPISLNGSRLLDGSWLLNQIFRGVEFAEMQIAAAFSAAYHTGMAAAYQIAWRELYNARISILRLSSELVNREALKGLSFVAETYVQLANRLQAVALQTALTARNRNIPAVSSFATYYRLSSKTCAAWQIGYGFGARHSYALAGNITMDSMYRLDGADRLDGSRRLNAGIIKEAI